MKTVSANQLERLASTHGASLTFDPYPCLDFGGYGFEATEVTDDEEYYGFRFFGHASKQSELIKVWTDLTEYVEMKPMLTIDSAKELMNKTVRISYVSTGGHFHEMIILIIGMRTDNNKQIGQDSHQSLLFKMIKDSLPDAIITDDVKDWIYEWQGIFRCTSGACIVYIEEVVE